MVIDATAVLIDYVVCVFLNLFGEKSMKLEKASVFCGVLEDWFTGDQQENLD